MQTVQACLRAGNREAILGALAWELLGDPISLLEMGNHTIKDIYDGYKTHMSGFIDRLLEMQPEENENMVVFLAETMLNGREEREVLLCDIREAAADSNAPYYDSGFTAWRQILGYHVADNKLTQDHLSELLARLLKDMAWMGTEEDARKARKEKLERSFQEAMKESGTPAEQVFEEIARKYGFPIDETDPVQDTLRERVLETQIRFTEYSRKRERKRLIERVQGRRAYANDECTGGKGDAETEGPA